MTRTCLSLLAVAILLATPTAVRAVILQTNGSPTTGDPNLALWYDATDLATLWQDTGGTIAAADGQPIARWDDKSGNGLNVTQASAANVPSYAASVARLNNMPAVSFIGGAGGDALSAVNTTGIDGNDDRTLVTVWQNTAFTSLNYQHTFHMGNATTDQSYGHSSARAGNAGSTIGNHYWGSGFDTVGRADMTPNIAISTWNGATTTDTWFLKGVDVGSTTHAALGGSGGQIQVGSRLNPFTEGFSGYLTEVILYDQVLTPTDRQALESYLGNKYGMAGNINTSQYSFNGSSRPAIDFLRLTNGGGSEAGSSFLQTPQSLLPDHTFNAHFAIQMSGGSGEDVAGEGPGADGMTFVIHQDPNGANAIGSAGAGIGAFGINNALVVEFDTWNSGNWDPASNNGVNGNHIAVNLSNQAESLFQTDPGSPSTLAPFTDGITRYVWIDYNGATDQMDIFMDTVNVKPGTPVLSGSVDLDSVLGPGQVFVGFTAGTGGAQANYDVLDFSLQTIPEPSSIALSAIGLLGVAVMVVRRRRRTH